MATNILTASANGIEAYADYVNILREEDSQLRANGVEYEEQDLRGDPLTTTLLIAFVTSAVTTTASEIVKRIIQRICDRAENSATPAPPPIQVVINTNRFVLPADRTAVIDELDRLAR